MVSTHTHTRKMYISRSAVYAAANALIQQVFYGSTSYQASCAYPADDPCNSYNM